MRNEIQALIIEKGLSSFYITINRADIYNPLVKILTGADIDINRLLPEQVPAYMEQSIFVAKNPFIAAQFFNIYLKAFLKIIIGYDESDSSHLPGMLGAVSAYYGCVEAQGCGTLHCHMMVWLQNVLNCDQIQDRVLSGDTDFQTCMITFIDDCISNEIQVLTTEPVTVLSDDLHSCSIRGITDLSAKLARPKMYVTLSRLVNLISILLPVTNIANRVNQENDDLVLVNTSPLVTSSAQRERVAPFSPTRFLI